MLAKYKINNMKKLLIILSLSILMISACKKDENPDPTTNIVKLETSSSRDTFQVYYEIDTNLFVAFVKNGSWSKEFTAEKGTFVSIQTDCMQGAGWIKSSIKLNDAILKDSTKTVISGNLSLFISDTL